MGIKACVCVRVWGCCRSSQGMAINMCVYFVTKSVHEVISAINTEIKVGAFQLKLEEQFSGWTQSIEQGYSTGGPQAQWGWGGWSFSCIPHAAL